MLVKQNRRTTTLNNNNYMTDCQQKKLEQVEPYISLMDATFKDLYEKFSKQQMVSIASLPKKPGVYVFYKDNQPIYVGRADNIRERISGHTRPGSNHNSANFAFNLTKLEFAEKLKESKLGRQALIEMPDFLNKFVKFKIELSASLLKYIEIENDIIQTMFEPYLALKLGTYPVNNNFDNH